MTQCASFLLKLSTSDTSMHALSYMHIIPTFSSIPLATGTLPVDHQHTQFILFHVIIMFVSLYTYAVK